MKTDIIEMSIYMAAILRIGCKYNHCLEHTLHKYVIFSCRKICFAINVYYIRNIENVVISVINN